VTPETDIRIFIDTFKTDNPPLVQKEVFQHYGDTLSSPSQSNSVKSQLIKSNKSQKATILSHAVIHDDYITSKAENDSQDGGSFVQLTDEMEEDR
jgi:hypothetical protein